MLTRAVLFFLSVVISSACFARHQPGFNKNEAKEMIAICNSFPLIDLYNSDAGIIPDGYKKKYTSGVFGMDNKYQVYQHGDVAVINLRGSTDKQLSWIENFYSAMIPAKGTMEIEGEKFDYCFALDEYAAVHSGYALGIGFLYKDLVYQINNFNREGIYYFIITGHSQGGALCNMLKALLENLPADQISKKNKFKAYSFAAPMIGNKEFAMEYNARYCADSTSYNIINPEDLIPEMPLNYNDSNYFAGNLNTWLFDRESFSLMKVIADGSALLFENKLGRLINWVGSSASKKIGKDVGPVVLPEYVKDINYHPVSNRVELIPFEYPKILKDSSILQNDSLMGIYERENDGYFLDNTLYKKGSWGYQHKPYNYYSAVLRMYFPDEYASLKKKYLSENL